MSTGKLDSFRFGVAAASLGMHPSHTLVDKFAALQKAGFKYVEVGFAGYMDWLRQELPELPPSTCPEEWGEGGEPDPSDEEIWEAMYRKADDLVALASKYGLQILMLQPLNQFEGWPESSPRAEWAKRKAQRWLTLCSKVGVEQVQVGSNDKPDATAPFEKIAQDLYWLADFAAQLNPPVKIAYESWCFGDRLGSWEDTWKLVQLANHPNLGLCLDTAQFPLSPDYGYKPRTGEGYTDKQFDEMLGRLAQVPGEKIFYVEISECLKPVVPLGQGSPFDEWDNKVQSPRGDRFTWAICGRPVPFIGRDAGRQVKTEADYGSARVADCLKTILGTGFNGPIMFEFFEALSMEQGDGNVPQIYSDAAAKSLKQIKSLF
ncbi:3-dehydroshikimate dehydratase [Kwoniella heveanensis CBS 569]|nr:3-dehydroshikimate dehydratase [Kwoniella heveanensis CBS 569]